jgi:CHAT domain-containing protein
LAGKTKSNVPIVRQVLNRLQQRDTIPAVIYAVFVPNVITANGSSQVKGAEAVPNFLRSGEGKPTDRLELILLNSTGQLTRRSTQFTRTQVAEQMAYFWLINNDTDHDQSFNTFGHQFYQWLLQSLEQDLKQAKIQTLIYVLDEGLRQIPIATMHRPPLPNQNLATKTWAMVSDRPWAIDEYNMSMVPSLGLLDLNIKLIRNQTTIAMGADRFERLQPLPAVPTELTIIGQQFAIGEKLLNQTFTYANLQQQIAIHRPGILHLATHADFNEGKPSDSYIQLWNQPLRLDQLNQLGLDQAAVELLVLRSKIPLPAPKRCAKPSKRCDRAKFGSSKIN